MLYELQLNELFCYKVDREIQLASPGSLGRHALRTQSNELMEKTAKKTPLKPPLMASINLQTGERPSGDSSPPVESFPARLVW